MSEKKDKLSKFVGDQLSCWPMACGNFRALKNVETREVEIGGLKVVLQFNPARMVSSAAKLDKESIAARKCFLCRENRFREQTFVKFDGRKGKRYHILLNPYPIFPDHLVIAMAKHVEQSILGRFVDMLDLSRKYPSDIFFYNGPHSGASAPDHHHFQAAPRGMMPLERDVDRLLDEGGETLEYLTSVREAGLYIYRKFTKGIFVMRAETSKSLAKLFYRLLDCAEILEGETEPRINAFTWYKDNEFRAVVVMRTVHRSHHYFSDGPDHLTMSPGCADMGGCLIVPVESEFHSVTPEMLAEMLGEVTIDAETEERICRRLTRTQPLLNVGIMSAKEIEFEVYDDGAGRRKAKICEGKIEYDGALYDELYFSAKTLSTMFAQPTFALYGVTIGAGFHWERKETQKFAGALRITVDNGRLTAINIIGVEDYLLSVISSEMRSTSSMEFLKAHAVISRSWVMAQLERKYRDGKGAFPDGVDNLPSIVSYLDSRCRMPEQDRHEKVYVKWYDHEDHKGFDVCADDHCQRYQGLTRVAGRNVCKAIDSTWGQVLVYGDELCDARFSKCCGGIMEKFSTCWEDRDYPYLQALPDTPGHDPEGKPFCRTSDVSVLSQVLNNYDRETTDFYEWTVEYGRDELSSLVASRSGVDVGLVTSVKALERGASGRISKLEIVGEDGRIVVGKELEIRRILSGSHLKSSAFDVVSDAGTDKFIFKGKGWGHGVGLCQIGAAVMASEGYDYRQILEHYYPGTEIKRSRHEREDK